jgi:hypothetical protein
MIHDLGSITTSGPLDARPKQGPRTGLVRKLDEDRVFSAKVGSSRKPAGASLSDSVKVGSATTVDVMVVRLGTSGSSQDPEGWSDRATALDKRANVLDPLGEAR